jgi:hypothetical protein
MAGSARVSGSRGGGRRRAPPAAAPRAPLPSAQALAVLADIGGIVAAAAKNGRGLRPASVDHVLSGLRAAYALVARVARS